MNWTKEQIAKVEKCTTLDELYNLRNEYLTNKLGFKERKIYLTEFAFHYAISKKSYEIIISEK